MAGEDDKTAPPPKPRGRPREGSEPLDVTLSTTLTESMYQRICSQAHQRNISVSRLVRTILSAAAVPKGPGPKK